MKKALALVLSLAALLGGTAGTLAWLAESGEVKNTFTLGRVAISLCETRDGEPVYDQSYPLIPGTAWHKDPVVQVAEGSEDCWLFVKFREPSPKPKWMNYTSNLSAAAGWTQGDGTLIPADVWYRTVQKSDPLRRWELLAGDRLAFDDTLTEDNMPADGPVLSYTAYACQKRSGDAEFTAPQAWEKVKVS